MVGILCATKLLQLEQKKSFQGAGTIQRGIVCLDFMIYGALLNG